VETRLNTYSIERYCVEQRIGVDDLRQFIQTLTQDAAQNRLRNLIVLSISGYGSDSKELYEVPDVCEYTRELQRALPVLFFFLDEFSAKRYVSWLCGPVSSEEIRTDRFQIQYKKWMEKCVENSWSAGYALLREACAPDEYLYELANDVDFERQATLTMIYM